VPRRDLRLLDPLKHDRQQSFLEFNRAVDLPGAPVGGHRITGDDEYDGICGLDQATEALLRVLAGRNVVPVERGLEARNLKADEQLLCRVLILAPARDEYLELAGVT
jgi:hypothetical protein